MVLKNLFTEQQFRSRHREKTNGHGERGGDGDVYGKSNVEISLSFIKQANGNLLYGSGNSNRDSVST